MKLLTVIFLINFILPTYSISQISEKENFLELSYQSFVQTKDLENAYAISKKATELYPWNKTWKERLFQICIWTGKIDQAMDILEKIYELDKNTNITNKYLREIKTKRKKFYENLLENKIKNGDENAFFELIDFYIETGEFEKGEKLINKNTKTIQSSKKFDKLAKFYLNSSNPDKALYYYEKTNKENICSFYQQVSQKYISQLKFKKAQEIILKNLEYCKKNSAFLSHLSDLSLLLNDFENMIKASLILYENNDYREIDGERLYLYYKNIDKKKSEEIALNSYLKFKKEYFLHYYLSSNPKIDFSKFNFIIPQREMMFIYLKKFEDLDTLKREELLNYSIKNSTETEFVSSYIWKIIESGNHFEKTKISEKYQCYESKRKILLPISYLKLSLNQTSQALECFQKAFSYNITPSIYASYGEFLDRAGFKTEGIYYKAIGYQYLKQKENKDESEIVDFLRLSLEFENNSYYLNGLKNWEISKKTILDLTLSYLSKYEMYDNIKKIILENKQASDWANFLISNYEKNLEEFEKINKDYISEKDKSSFFDYFSKRQNAIENAQESIIKSPDDFETRLNYNRIIENYIPEKDLSFEYLDRNTSKSLNYKANIEKYFKNNIYYGFVANFSDINFYDKTFFNTENEKFSYFKFYIKGLKWETSLRYNNLIKKFYSFEISKNFKYNQLENNIFIGIKNITNETFLLELSGYENKISNQFIYRISNKSNFVNTLSLKEYYDQNNFKIGKGFINEFGYESKIKDLYIKPYLKVGSFDEGTRQPDYTVNKILKNIPNKIIPEDFKEYGISLIWGQKYFKRYSFPIYFSMSYNDKTKLNYYIELYIKLKKLYKIDWELKTRYSKSSSTNKDKIFGLETILKFR